MNAEKPIAPPPPPVRPPVLPSGSPISYGIKIFLMGVLCCLLMIGVLAVWVMSDSRESTNADVADRIVGQWGREVFVDGPVLCCSIDSVESIRPQAFDCIVNVGSRSLHRGIYEAEVFGADVRLSCSFGLDSLAASADTLVLKLAVDPKSVSKTGPLNIGGKQFRWSKYKDGLYAEIDLSDISDLSDLSTELSVHGSGAVFVRPIGGISKITMEGEASNPSFDGSLLPENRTVGERGFYASWETESFPSDESSVDSDASVGVRFLVGVDRYQKVSRSLKYSFIIILLTFVSVLFTEIVMHHPIPLLNYFLIGAALILFYSLLLAFSEHTSFGAAYLIAAAMTVALITGYMWRMLGSRIVGVTIGLILSGMYVSCYIMLCVSTYALLLGSLILFVVLAGVMYGSLKIKN